MKYIKLLLLFTLFSHDIYSQNINIPDDKFKEYLIANTDINTNGDFEIDSIEAASFTGKINVGMLGILDMTGIQGFTQINELRCNSNWISSLDVSKNTMLTTLKCHSNKITSLDVSQNTMLEVLTCTGNLIPSLDVSNNTALTTLYCSVNLLTELDITNNPLIKYLECGFNDLDTLDISNNLLLIILKCSSNKLTEIDISNHVFLENVSCYSNELTSLNIANGNNINISEFWIYDNANLYCTTVDDVAWANSNWWSKKEVGSIYSNDCTLGVQNHDLNTNIVNIFDLYGRRVYQMKVGTIYMVKYSDGRIVKTMRNN